MKKHRPGGPTGHSPLKETQRECVLNFAIFHLPPNPGDTEQRKRLTLNPNLWSHGFGLSQSTHTRARGFGLRANQRAPRKISCVVTGKLHANSSKQTMQSNGGHTVSNKHASKHPVSSQLLPAAIDNFPPPSPQMLSQPIHCGYAHSCAATFGANFGRVVTVVTASPVLSARKASRSVS